MPVVVSDLAITLSVAALGVLFGWLMRAITTQNLAISKGTVDDEGEDSDRAREVLAKLHDLVAQVAADVGEHSHRMESINEELSTADVCEPDAVVKAVSELMLANSTMQRQLSSAEGKLEKQAVQIQTHATAARTDALTGLANRRAFDDEIARRDAEFRRHGRTFSVLMIDVDHFKKFNDTHGHQAGDEVLRGVGQVLRQTAREMDLVARYGGEEFSVIFPGTSVSEAKGSVERIRQAIERACFDFDGTELRVTISLGVANMLTDEDTDTLIQRADMGLYAAKEGGRNCAYWHDGQSVHRITAARDKSKPVASTKSPTPSAANEKKATPPAANEKKATPPAAKKPAPSPAPPAAPKPKANGGTQPPETQGPSLYNRTEFCLVLDRRLAEWRRGGPMLSLLLVKVDNYAKLMARYGQSVSDQVLQSAAKFLSGEIRDMDLLAQYDEAVFAMLLPEAELTGAVDVAERIRNKISKWSLPAGKQEVSITASLSGARATEGDDLQGLLGRCEKALRKATESGGNCTFFHIDDNCEPAASVAALSEASN